MTRAEHFALPPDRPTELAHRRYRGWDGGTYELLSHHPCGYHLRLLATDGSKPQVREVGDLACVTERAIGSTFRELPSKTGHDDSPADPVVPPPGCCPPR